MVVMDHLGSHLTVWRVIIRDRSVTRTCAPSALIGDQWPGTRPGNACGAGRSHCALTHALIDRAASALSAMWCRGSVWTQASNLLSGNAGRAGAAMTTDDFEALRRVVQELHLTILDLVYVAPLSAEGRHGDRRGQHDLADGAGDTGKRGGRVCRCRYVGTAGPQRQGEGGGWHGTMKAGGIP